MENTKTRVHNEAGNAFVYILIAVILFGSLSFMMSRSSTNSGAKSELDGAQLSFQVEAIIKYVTEVQSVLLRMEASGTNPDDFDFMLPSDANFDTAPNYNKVYHSAGGGLYEKQLLENMKNQVSAPTPSAWYLSRFNNVEWTPSTSNDVILAAHQITEELCGALNKKLIGSSDIPILSSSLSEKLIDRNLGGHSSNSDFDASDCADCEGKPMLCVENSANTAWTFYAIVMPR